MSYRPIHPVSLLCRFCKTAFTPRRRDAKYCSSSCCTRAHYARRGRPHSRQLAKADTPEQKEVGFGKLMGASVAANVVVEVVETVFDIGKVAQINKMQVELRQVHQKLDLLLKQNSPTPFSSLSIADPFDSLSLLKMPVPIKFKK